VHKEPEAEEDRPQDHLQRMLVGHEQEKAVQERKLMLLPFFLSAVS
jgi:hypothetical protein